MQSLRSFVPACFVVALLFGGFILDEAMANNQPLRCAPPILGCGNVACFPAAGNCPGGGLAYTNSAQQAFNYIPCTAVVGAACPNPLNFKNDCFSGGYNLNANGQCTLVCGVWTGHFGC